MAHVIIEGVIVDAETGRGVPGLHIAARDARHSIGRALGETVSRDGGEFALPLADELLKRLERSESRAYFVVSRGDKLIADTADTVTWDPHEQEPVEIIVELGDDEHEPKDTGYRVAGRVVSERGAAGAGLRVVAVDRRLRGEVVLGEARTNASGEYAIAYALGQLGGKRLADIEVRVSTGREGGEIGRSKTAYQAPREHTIDVVVAHAVLDRGSEFERLRAAVAPLLDDSPLADVNPDGVMYLANRANWDPRLIAMAVAADRASADTGIVAEHYYAMFRTGATTAATGAPRLTDERVRTAIETAEQQGLITRVGSVDATVEAHHASARQAIGAFVPTGGVSSVDDLLSLHLEGDRRDLFVDRLRGTAGDPAALWDSLGDAGFEPELVDQLRLDGKLGFLTRHNAPVIRRLTGEAGVRRVEDLVGAGLYQAGAWEPLIDGNVPDGISADDYAAGLALQVRLAFPTAVTGELVRSGAVALPAAQSDASGAIADFLASGEHRLGAVPVSAWSGFDALDADVQAGVQTVQRLYQLTPSDESMTALAATGFDSAAKIAYLDEGEWIASHGDAFPSLREAQLVHRKAQQTHAFTLNLAVDYINLHQLPGVYSLGAALEHFLGDGDGVPVAATLENLFGNLDFCACEHCRSVLSPAAYLVDMFEFLDLTGQPHALENPIDVLFARRPDLQHLQLSCENTNTALPYVDLVNEILEHYVINGDLAGFVGHDVAPGAESADLLVDPQFVEEAAYTVLAGEVFPPPLPLDVPLEALRLQFEAWGTSLAAALALLGQPPAARRERLGLSDAEWSILTDVDAHPLPAYFNEPGGASIGALNDAIRNAKVLCRRMGVSYLEMERILSARFVNPAARLVDLFTPLGVTVATLREWADGAVTDAELAAMLPADVDADAYGGDIGAWLAANRDELFTLIVLQPMADADMLTDDCDFAMLELHRADPANSDLTALELHRLHRFVRIWKALDATLGADIDATDRLIAAFIVPAPEAIDLAGVDDACAAVLARLANFVLLLDAAGVSRRKRDLWLALFDQSVAASERGAQLARLLRLGDADFSNLSEITGIDPLAADLDSDAPSITRFVTTYRAISAARLKVDDLDYLTRDADPAGTRIPDADESLAEVRTVRAAIAAVDASLAVATGADLGTAQSRMALVYAPDTVAEFFGLVTGTASYRSALATVEEALPAPLAAVTPAIGFDPFTDQVTFVGPMGAADQAALNAAAASLTLADVEQIDNQPDLDAHIAALHVAIDDLHAQPAAAIAAFGAAHPELAPVLVAALAAPDTEAQAAAVLGGILGPLRGQLVETAVRANLATLLRADEAVIAALTSDPDVLHASLDAGAGIMSDLVALGDAPVFDHDANFAMLVAPPATGQYLWYAAAPAGTQVELRVGGVVVIAMGAVGPSGEVAGVAATALEAGRLVNVELDVAGLAADEAAELRWRADGLDKQAIATAALTAAAAAETATTSLRRLRKAVTVADKLRLTANELAYIAVDEPDTAGVLNDLPVGAAPPASAVHALWEKLARLAWFSGFKRDNEPDTDVFVTMLSTAALADAAGRQQLATVAAWRPADIADVLAHLGAAGDGHRRIDMLRAIAELVTFAVDAGVTVAELTAWTTAAPDDALITTIRDAVKAQLDPAAYRETMQSVNDALRNMRREALVTHILAHDPPKPEIDTANQLYENFLVDVEMDACMQTSRIRLALSTVQLFITRCLMNLEAEVSPDSIRADRWEWMKRYRVWEANRKVFLWPENWLEPELRDGKSPFFRELESELLKADITTDLAEDAFLSYLKKLDDVAKLEIVGCYLDAGAESGTDDDVLHVIGRTNGKTRQYWYRRYEYGTWTPWEKISLEIEGDLVLPVVWRRQLFLFWTTVVERPRAGSQNDSPDNFASQRWRPRSRTDVDVTLNWGELYRGQWTSPKSTNMRKPIVIPGVLGYRQERLLMFSRTEKPDGAAERLVFSVIYLDPGNTKAYKAIFTSKNASPIVIEDDPDNQLLTKVALFYEELYWKRQSEATLDANSLDVPRTDATLRIAQPSNSSVETRDARLLTKQFGFKGWNVHTVMHPVANQWEAPWFYADEHSTFFVQPDEWSTNFSILEEYTPIEIGPFIPPVLEVIEPPVIPDPIDPLWDPPWIEYTNPNIATVLPDTSGFELDGWNFNALGLMR